MCWAARYGVLIACAMLCSVCLHAQTPTPSPTPTPPPYQQQRYDEDWSYLKDHSKRTDPLDSLKYIPLNDRGWYVSLGGEARVRYDYFSQFAFGAGPQDSNGYWLQRYLLHADWHLGKRVRVFTQTPKRDRKWPQRWAPLNRR